MSWLMLEYQCPACGERIESLERRADPATALPHCGALATRIISAVAHRMSYGTVTRGKNEAPPPGVIDTRPLADGMPVHEWRAQRRKISRDRRLAEIAAKL